MRIRLGEDSGKMEGSEVVVADANLDVTIYLVQKPAISEAGSSTRSKRRRTNSSMHESEGAHGVTLGQVKAKSSRLRHCSTYFETCMSERWTKSETKSKLPSEMEFHLEVQTDVRYYKDCFSRMHCLFKRIGSVACCIELLKVASQIGYQDVIDIGVKYLAAAPWSSDYEEKQVREFCGSAHLIPFSSLSDLNARFLGVPLAEQEKQVKLSSCAKDLLTRYLQYALPLDESMDIFEARKQCPESSKKFSGAFILIVSGSEPGVCESVVEHALALMKQMSVRLLSTVKQECKNEAPRGHCVKYGLNNIRWLWKVARKANASQIVVEVLLDDDEVADILSSTNFGQPGVSDILNNDLKWTVKQWGEMLYTMFQDVLEGKLFLTTSQRVALLQWRWLLHGGYLDRGEEQVAQVLTRFLTTLPQQHQEDFWLSATFRPGKGPSVEAHTMWLSHMLTRKAPPEPDVTSSSSEECVVTGSDKWFTIADLLRMAAESRHRM